MTVKNQESRIKNQESRIKNRAKQYLTNKTVGVFISVPAKFSRKIDEIDYGPAIRQEVIDRWYFSGFDVFTVNSKTEAAELRGQLNNIEIIEVEDQGRVKISSISKSAIDRKYDTVIIANADCIPIDCKLMCEIVGRVQSNEVCLLGRSNIPAETLEATREHFPGFDVFIVGSDALKKAPSDTSWRIGDVWWDYWFPFYLMERHTSVYKCSTYNLMHLNHPAQWDEKLWYEKAKQFFAEFPIGSINYGRVFNNKYGQYINRPLSFRDVQKVCTNVVEIVGADERNIVDEPGSFNELHLRVIKDRFGPLKKLSKIVRILNALRD